MKLGHRHGGNGPGVVRVHHVQQCLRDFREIVVQPEVNAGGQQRHRFDQPLHVRILAAVRLEQQPRRHLGILLGEFRALLAQERQLALVISQQLIAHGRLPRLQGGIEKHACRRRLHPQQRLDLEMQHAAGAGGGFHVDPDVHQAGLEGGHGRRHHAHHPVPILRRTHRHRGCVRQAVAVHRAPQLLGGDGRFPGRAAGIEQPLQVPAHRILQLVHRL